MLRALPLEVQYLNILLQENTNHFKINNSNVPFIDLPCSLIFTLAVSKNACTFSCLHMMGHGLPKLFAGIMQENAHTLCTVIYLRWESNKQAKNKIATGLL